MDFYAVISQTVIESYTVTELLVSVASAAGKSKVSTLSTNLGLGRVARGRIFDNFSDQRDQGQGQGGSPRTEISHRTAAYLST